MFSTRAISRIKDSTRGRAQERRRHECLYRIFTDDNRKRELVPYDIVFHAVDKNRERASHKSVPYFRVPCEEIPAKSCWPSYDEEVVNEDKSSGRWPSTVRLTREIPAKSRWPLDNKEVVDKDKSSRRWPSTMMSTKKAQLTLAVDDEVDESKSS